MNYVNLAANEYIYSENEQKSSITSDLCNFKFILWDDSEIGWSPSTGIKITVDGIDYGFVNLLWGTSYGEVIVPLSSGEVQLVWHGGFAITYHFEVYNSLDELIFTGTHPLAGLFLTYQNKCIECLPIIDFEGVYNSEEHYVNLNWIAPESTDLIGFDIYRNDVLIDSLPPSTVSYIDNTEALENGDYKYCVVPVYPIECDLDEECFETPINVGIKNYKDNITIYPNPATNVITISSNRVLAVKMYNNIGQLILNEYNTNERFFHNQLT